MDLEKNAKDILDGAQSQWWSTGTCKRTKETHDNAKTKTETCATPQLNSKKVTDGQMKGRKGPDRPRDVLLDWLLKKEYKVDYNNNNNIRICILP